MGLEVLGARWLPKLRRAFTALGAEALLEQPDVEARCMTLLDLIAAWNQRTDLTAARSPDELVDLVVADAAVIARAEQQLPAEPAQSWLDVGSGMGAPGFALALLLPNIQVTLIEPRQKRVAFLRTVQGSLGPLKVRVERSRSDALPAQHVSVAVSRATFAPQAWLTEGARLASVVWVLLATDSAPELDGWQQQLALDYHWPLTGGARRALRYTRGPARTSPNEPLTIPVT